MPTTTNSPVVHSLKVLAVLRTSVDMVRAHDKTLVSRRMKALFEHRNKNRFDYISRWDFKRFEIISYQLSSKWLIGDG